MDVMADVERTGIVREAREIRELHKYRHAPFGNSCYDLEGRPRFSSYFSEGSHSDNVPRRRSRLASEFSKRWVQKMADDQGCSISPSLDSRSRGVRSPRPTSRLSSSRHNQDHSASPRQRVYQHCRENSPPDFTVARQRAVTRLRQSCAVITHNDMVWTMPSDLGWDLTFLNESFLLFPDGRTLTRMRYWAVCHLNFLDVRQLLELAISRNLKFVMATKLSDLRIFKPAVVPELLELMKHTYEAGFQEEHLKDVNGGAAFHDQYMGKLANILHRPHARALISMGGPTAWIAKHYGGSSLVQRFMDSPSTQVTIHHRGAVASSPFCDDALFYDQVSAQEENLVHGFVSTDNSDHHRWLFPTTEIMDDYCHHW